MYIISLAVVIVIIGVIIGDVILIIVRPLYFI